MTSKLLTGFSKKDINVEVEAGKLTINSVKDKDTQEVEDNDGVLHKIFQRDHLKGFGLLQMM